MYSFWLTAVEAWRLTRRNRANLVFAIVILSAALTGCLFSAGMRSALFVDDGSALPTGITAVGTFNPNNNNGQIFDLLTDAEVLALRAQSLPELQQMVAYRSANFSLVSQANLPNNVSSSAGANSTAIAEQNDPWLAVAGTWVDGGLFKILRWDMHLGRDFDASDFHGEYADAPGAVARSDVAIIGYDLWQTRFQASPAIIGSDVTIDGVSRKIIGVLGPNRAFPVSQQVYLPFRIVDVRSLGNSEQSPRYFRGLTRMASPAVETALRAALAVMDNERAKQLAPNTKLHPFKLAKLNSSNVTSEESTKIFIALTVVSWLVLVLASINVGGLLLVHFLSRLPELATRAALGSNKVRLFGAILMQSCVLVLLAYGLAHTLTQWWIPHFEDLLRGGQTIPSYVHLTYKSSMIMPMVLACVLSATMVALPVLLRLRERVLINQLRGNTRSSSNIGRIGLLLMLVQCALSIGTVLFALMAARGAQMALMRDLGLQNARIAVAAVSGSDPVRVGAAANKFAQAFAARPEAELVSVGQTLPLINVIDREVVLGGGSEAFNVTPVDQNFAQMYKLELRAGRWISAENVANRDMVAVIDMTAAIAAFGTPDALGRELTYINDRKQKEMVKIIGIVQTAWLDLDLGSDHPSVFVPVRPDAPLTYYVHVRVKPGQDVNAFAASMSASAAQVDQTVAIREAHSFKVWFQNFVFGFKLVALLFAPLGVLAMLLAATGLAGLFGSLVAKRMRDSAIRRSLGAGPMALLKPLLKPPLVAAAIGIAVGLLVAWPLSSNLNDLLYGGTALSWSTTIMALVVVLSALVLACILPARRALKSDPLLILKQD